MIVRSWRLVGIASTRSDQRGVFGVELAGVSEQGADRSEASVAGPDRVVADVFEVIEKRRDELGIKLGEIELGGRRR
jgi:hypothetical protein